MALIDSFGQLTAQMKDFAAALDAVSDAPLRIIVSGERGQGSDTTEAEAIARGQRIKQVAAMRKALGL